MGVEISVPQEWFGQDWWGAVSGALYEGGDELGAIEQFNVSKRTPVDTGALLTDVSYQAPGTGSGSGLLAYIYADDTNQLDEWNRYYAVYQEGGLLGLSTYTNAPHEMFAQIMTTDIPAIEEWGEKWAQIGLDRLLP